MATWYSRSPGGGPWQSSDPSTTGGVSVTVQATGATCSSQSGAITTYASGNVFPLGAGITSYLGQSQIFSDATAGFSGSILQTSTSPALVVGIATIQAGSSLANTKAGAVLSLADSLSNIAGASTAGFSGSPVPKANARKTISGSGLQALTGQVTSTVGQFATANVYGASISVITGNPLGVCDNTTSVLGVQASTAIGNVVATTGIVANLSGDKLMEYSGTVKAVGDSNANSLGYLLLVRTGAVSVVTEVSSSVTITSSMMSTSVGTVTNYGDCLITSQGEVAWALAGRIVSTKGKDDEHEAAPMTASKTARFPVDVPVDD